MINVDLRDIKQFEQNAKATGNVSVKLTVKSTLNKLAFETADKSKKKVLPEKFTLRNKYIASTVRYESVRGNGDISSMASFAGQIASFKGNKTNQLEHQELGKPVIASGKYTKAPTAFTRGGSFTKRIQKAKRFSSLQGGKGIVRIKDIAMHPSKFVLNQAAAIAKKKKEQYNIVAVTKKGVKGVFKVTGSSVKLLYRFTDKANKIKQTQWLRPTADAVMKDADKYFVAEAKRLMEKSLSKNLKRL